MFYKKLLRISPYILTVLTGLNVVLEYHFHINAYSIACVLFSSLLFVHLYNQFPKRLSVLIQRIPFLTIYFLWFIALFIIEILTASYYKSPLFAIKSVVTLIWMPVYFVLFLLYSPTFNISKFIVFHIGFACVIAVLGYIQKFFSADIFGLIPAVKWQLFFEINPGRLRCSSILGSPQVYGLYCILTGIMLFSNRFTLSPVLRWAGFTFFVIAGLLSGNRSVIGIVILFMLIKGGVVSKISSIVVAVSLILILSGSIISNINNDEKNTSNFTFKRTVAWIFDSQKFIETEKEGRWKRYERIFEESNVLYGNALGVTVPNKDGRGMIPESYLLQLYAEAGIIPIVLLFWFVYEVVKNANRQKTIVLQITLCIMLSWFFVHAFISQVFLPFWGLLIYNAYPFWKIVTKHKQVNCNI